MLLPDARPAVPVVEIAQRVWAALGHAGEPPMRVIGLRPGERLHEELTTGGEWFTPATYAGILRVRGIAPAPAGTPIAAGITDLLAAVEAATPDADLKARALAWAGALSRE